MDEIKCEKCKGSRLKRVFIFFNQQKKYIEFVILIWMNCIYGLQKLRKN